MLVLHYIQYQSYLPILWMTIFNFNVRSSQIDSTDISILIEACIMIKDDNVSFVQK